MEQKLERKYGLFTAICMVVGVVIGSGIFFKAEAILGHTGGNMLVSILSLLVGAVVIISCSLAFSTLATKYEKNNGVVDYAEAIVGEKYGYVMGWFLSTIYYPAITSVLAWVSARYTLVIFNPDANITGGLCMALGAFYICIFYVLNQLAPRLAGKVQVSATVIKLTPLLIMAIVGLIVGLVNGNTAEAFGSSLEMLKTPSESSGLSTIFAAVVSAAFAYDGWIIATSINAELHNPKKNLPIALTVGALIVAAIYIFYFIAVVGVTSVDVIIEKGSNAAFTTLFGNVAGTILNVFIAVACLGTLNGVSIANSRGLYSLAVRGHGPAPETLSTIDAKSNMPTNSGLIGLLLAGFWYFYFYAANLDSVMGVFSFDSSELPIITLYAMYIPIFAVFMIKEGKKSFSRNILVPVIAIIAAAFMAFSAFYAHGIKPLIASHANGGFSCPALIYLAVFAIDVMIGLAFYNKKRKNDLSL